MFNPSRDDVRRFFCATWRKHITGSVLTPLEATALKWIVVHPEYHALLADEARSLHEEFTVEQGRTNPFLHLSMHLAIEEQLAIDQPPGIRAVFQQLAARGDEHSAQHQTMECLGRVLWEAQRGTLPADAASINDAYLTCLKRQLG